MRRFASILGAALAWLWIMAAEALAQYPPSKPPPTGQAGSGAGSGVAFTGASISLGVTILVLLLVLGAVLFLLGRRRSRIAALS